MLMPGRIGEPRKRCKLKGATPPRFVEFSPVAGSAREYVIELDSRCGFSEEALPRSDGQRPLHTKLVLDPPVPLNPRMN
jgi:hypothetical protein